jgi:hypothetical protein
LQQVFLEVPVLIRFIAVPAFVSLVGVAIGWLYVRRVPQPIEPWQAWEERDPVGPSEDVILALGRTSSMKFSTEAEALAFVGDDDV